MPRGVYRHRDPLTGEAAALEHFSCAPGPAGWRYVAEGTAPAGGVALGRIDVTVDAAWRQIRVEAESGGWLLRGGVAGTEVSWLRQPAAGFDADLCERSEVAAGFIGRSPAFAVAVARLLG